MRRWRGFVGVFIGADVLFELMLCGRGLGLGIPSEGQDGGQEQAANGMEFHWSAIG